MANRIVPHKKQIESKTLIGFGGVNIGDIISFSYRAKDVYDRLPLVFVTRKKAGKIHGVNLNYMKEFFVQRLLKEKNMRNLRYWDDYKHAFRTYSSTNMSVIRKVDYKTDEEKKEDRKDQREEAKK
tara:strand:- start:150 stop:527 length:378 start_codon:yes stop_codon:yes gene_type:complete